MAVACKVSSKPLAALRNTRSEGDAFDRDELVQTWIFHNLQIIGEAARNVSRGLQARYPEVPWRQIVAMRNILVHDYFTVDLEEVWAAVVGDIPDLKIRIQSILRELGGTR